MSRIWDYFCSWWQRFTSSKHENTATFAHSLLCVDDDFDFCLYVQRVAQESQVKCDKAHSIAEAKQKIEQRVYDAFIIDGHLPDGSGFELVTLIREKIDSDSKIAFLSRIYQDSTSFRLLKETFKVNYVLDKPLNFQAIKHLIENLCLRRLSLKASELPEKLLSDIKLEYQNSIPDKLERLEKMILAIQKNLTLENLENFKREIHKIAGSAGSYGYSKVTDLCKQMEEEVTEQIELFKINSYAASWDMKLDDFFTQIKFHFQFKPD
jgi:DNA-binding response OmpR family regulator